MQDSKKSKIISIILVSAIVTVSLLVFLIPPLLTKKYDEELIIYNWADYIDVTILDDFAEYYEEVTGKSIKIVYTNFDTNETMITEMIKGDSNIDIICPSEYAIEKLLRNNVLEKIDWSVLDEYGIDNYAKANIEPRIWERIDSVFSDMQVAGVEGTINMSDYFIPYMYGTLGILYNCNVISEEEIAEAGWGILWNSLNKPELNGKILVKDSIRDTYVCAVLYLKETNRLPEECKNMSVEELINCTYDSLVSRAEEVLKEQRDTFKGYEVDFGKDDMINGTALVDLAWSGDAMYAIEESYDENDEPTLDYYIPESGSNIWFDGWVMPKNAKNKTAALLFMNYLCRPDIAMYNTLEIGYSSAVSNDSYFDLDEEGINAEYSALAIEALLECYEIDVEDEEAVNEFFDEFFNDTRRYPDFDAELGMMSDFGEQNENIVKMWERVKAYGETENWAVLGIIIGVLVALCAVVVGFAYVKFNKKPRARAVEETQ